MAVDTDDLIQRHVEEDPQRPGPANARLIEQGVHIWALIGHLRAVGNQPEVVADDYGLTGDAMRAAIAYYERHRALIDAKLSANASRPRKTSSAA